MPARPRKPTTHRLTWRHAAIEIRHTADYLGEGRDHLEVRLRKPKGAPLPITGTGYRSEFVSHEEIADAGGPVAFVRTWLDREARTPAWEKLEFKWRQLEFDLVAPRPAPAPRPVRRPRPARARRTGHGSA